MVLVTMVMSTSRVVAIGLAPLKWIAVDQPPLRLYGLRHGTLRNRTDDKFPSLDIHGFEQTLVGRNFEVTMKQHDSKPFELPASLEDASELAEACNIAIAEIVIDGGYVLQ